MSANNEKKMNTSDRVNQPDSTTKDKLAYMQGEDVLVMKTDGRFYLGTVVEICLAKDRCLVKFGDGTERWSFYKNLTRLSIPEENTVTCVTCKSSQISDDNDIIVCDKCARGYHQKCHQPIITSSEMSYWKCGRCSEKDNDDKSDIYTFNAITTLPSSNKFPYNMNELVWDVHHTMNTAQQYCYCGGSGEWFLKMIQCNKCGQWFHEHCVHCLVYPLYLGDRFYVFVCSVCNLGTEFLRRIEIEWVDIVHLVIFNLIAYRAKRYYDLTEILKCINTSWSTLQLPPKIHNTAIEDRKNVILNVLMTNKNRFRCFSKAKKRTTWGLESRSPPTPPKFTLPDTFPLTDSLLRAASKDNNSFKFFITTGEDRASLRNGREKELNWLVPTNEGIELLRVGTRPVLLPKGVSATGHKVCIKSATPFSCDRSAVEKRIKQQKETQKKNRSSTTRKRQSSESAPDDQSVNKEENKSELRKEEFNNSKSSSVAESSEPMDKSQETPIGLNGIISPIRSSSPIPKSPDVPKSPSPDLPKPSSRPQSPPKIELSVSSMSDLPPTPPPSIPASETPNVIMNGGPPTPPMEEVELPKRVSFNINKGVTISQLLGSLTKNVEPKITLPLSLNKVVTEPLLRTTKRRLSEKDIRINRNGEVKRRRLRRQCTISAAKRIELCQQSKKYTGIVNGLRTAIKQSALAAAAAAAAAVECKPSSGIAYRCPNTINDLKSCVYNYYKDEKRSTDGDNYTVLGKRITDDGKVQYLVEWNNDV